jgi:hypothetical protein
MSTTPDNKPAPKPVWFNPVNRGTPRAYSISHVFDQRASMARDFAEFTSMSRPGQAWLCGYVLPPFQRPVVWDEERMMRFIESAASGLDLGEWVFVDASHVPNDIVDGKSYFNRVDRWLIDGQQRFTALDRFWADAFPARGSTGKALYWSEVPPVERRRFMLQPFGAKELNITDEATLRRYYDLHNFGGVPHTEDQRASPAS